MCGFVGFIGNKKNKEKIIKNMTDKIIHRGPDSEGYFNDDFVSFGFRRLSILDLKDRASQPMESSDNNYVIVFNGEIYNHLEIKEKLLKKGYKFKTTSDTEVLLYGYIEYKEKILKELRGMFAFTIYDKKNKLIFGARDIFGIKPYYYYKDNEEFMFASELKAFLPNPDFKKEFNSSMLPEYLTFEYIPNNETFFKNAYKLNPGHYYIYKDNKINIFKYNEIKYNIDESKSLEYFKEELMKRLTESVKAHMISDVEVGSFLSSGIDSSYVLNEVSKITKVKSFSVGFDNEKINEIPHAKKFADSIGVTNYSKTITSDEFFEVLPKCQYYMDEPLSNVSAIPLYFVSKEASKKVKVVLSGEGADELFGGYHTYFEPFEIEKYKFIPFKKLLKSIVINLNDFHGKNLLIKLGTPLEKRYIGMSYVMNKKEINKVLKEKQDIKEPYFYTKNIYKRVEKEDDITKMQYLDMHMWMLQDILLKADRMTMANSIEGRVPFLDKEILDLAIKIPSKYRVSKTNNKIVLREATKEKLGEFLSNRPKLSFPVPVGDWIKEDKYYKDIKEKFNSNIAYKYFNIDYINKLLDNHKNKNKRNTKKIMTIYCFILWYKEYFGVNNA